MTKYGLIKPAKKITLFTVCLLFFAAIITVCVLSVVFYAEGKLEQPTMVAILAVGVPLLSVVLYVSYFALYLFSFVIVQGDRIEFHCWRRSYSKSAFLSKTTAAHEVTLCPVARIDIGSETFLILCFGDAVLDASRYRKKYVTNNVCLGLIDVIRQNNIIVAPLEAEKEVNIKKK